MATKINADTVVGGAVVTADASGILELQSAGTTALTLSGANVTFATAPSVTGGADVVTTTGTQTLTNKTLQNPNITSGLLLSSSAGTSGQVLVSNGAGNAPTWGSAGETTPVGAVQYFAGTSTATYPGSKWLQANGATVSQSTYSTLYSRVGLISDYYAQSFTTTTIDNSTYRNILSVVYANNLFVSTANNQIRTSTNGINWTNRGNAGYSAAYLNGAYFVSNVGNFYTSTDGTTWTARTVPDSGQILYGMAYGNGVYVYCGSSGAVGTSTDAVTWTQQTVAPRNSGSTCAGVTFGDGKFYMAGRYYDGVTATTGFVATSTNGVTWSVNSSFAGTNYMNFVTYANNTILTGGQTSTGNATPLYVSTDGNTSYSTVSIGMGILYSGNYYNGMFIVTGNQTAYSYDAISWKLKNTNNGPVYGTAVAPALNRFVAASLNGEIHYGNAFSYNSATDFKLPISTNNLVGPGTFYVRATA